MDLLAFLNLHPFKFIVIPIDISIFHSCELKECWLVNIQPKYNMDIFQKDDLLNNFDIIFDKIFKIIIELIQYQLNFFSETPLDSAIFQDYHDKFRDKYFHESLNELKSKLDLLNFDDRSDLQTYRNIHYVIFFELYIKIYHSLYEELYINIQSEFPDKFYFTLYVKFSRVLFPIICYEVDYYLLPSTELSFFDFLLQFF